MRNGHFITDYHCHSTVSPDGHNTMREMAEAAVRLGVDDLCFTDHIEPLPWDRWNEPPREKHSYDWAPMLAQFREAQEAVGGRIKLHIGAELGECSFAPDVADSFLDDAPPLDFTIGSVHCYRTASGEVNDLTWITSTDPAVWYAACESYFEEMEKLIDWGRFQVLGHITLPLRWAKELRGVELDFDRYEEQLRHVMRRAIEKGLGIECNTNRGHLPLPDGKWLRLYHELGGELITLRLDDRTAVYTADLLSQLDMAYAVTVHKSQGSEYPAVILAAASAAPSLLVRGVLYTAITRARRLLILAGDDAVLAQMAANNKQQRRYSGLRRRLKEGYHEQ